MELSTDKVEYCLIVDDEKLVLRSLSILLRTLGYSVQIANSGFEAIDILKKYKNQISLILLDYQMPEMDGGQTLIKLKQVVKSCPIYISSGYLTLEMEEKLTLKGANGFLHKPYTSKDILDIISNHDLKPRYIKGEKSLQL